MFGYDARLHRCLIATAEAAGPGAGAAVKDTPAIRRRGGRRVSRGGAQGQPAPPETDAFIPPNTIQCRKHFAKQWVYTS